MSRRCSEITNINDKYCLQKDDTFINLYPEKNLLNGEPNSVLYLNRLVDELIRNTFLYNYMTSSNTFLAFNNSTFEINSDEFMLLSSAFEQNYFDNMIPYKQANISAITDIDYAIPSKTIAYMKNKVKLFDDTIPKNKPQIKPETSIDLDLFESVGRIKGALGKTFKTSDFKEYEIKNNPSTNTTVFSKIISEFTGIDHSVEKVKQDLLTWYSGKIETNELKTLLTLKHQGKQKMMQAIFEGKTTLENVIMSEMYYFTNLDIMGLAEIYKLPLVLIATTKLQEQIIYNSNLKSVSKEDDIRNDKYWFSSYSTSTSNLLIIKQYAVSRNLQTIYSIIKDNTFVSTHLSIPDFVRKELDKYRGKQLEIDTLINSFKPSKVSANKLKKKVLRKKSGSPVKKLKKIVIKKKKTD